MTITINGTTGIAGVDGSAGTPSYQGNDSNTGIFFPAADTIAFAEGGVEVARFDSAGNFGLGVTPSAWSSSFKVLQLPGGTNYSFQNQSFSSGQNFYIDSGLVSRYSNTAAASIYIQETGAHKWYTAPSGTAGNAISFTQAMTLDANNNLLLGTTSANGTAAARVVMEIKGGTAGALFNLSDASGWRGYLWADNAGGKFEISAVGATTPMAFVTNGAERARIASGGQFCVNTTNTNGAFNVSGNIYLFSQTTGAGSHFLKYNAVTGLVTIDTSSRLVKDNIVDSPYGLAEVMQLKSRKYFRTDDQREEIGLVADEVQSVLPEFVPMSAKSIFTGDEADTELVPSGVYYEKLSSVLIKAIQEQQAIISELTTRIAALEAK